MKHSLESFIIRRSHLSFTGTMQIKKLEINTKCFGMHSLCCKKCCHEMDIEFIITRDYNSGMGVGYKKKLEERNRACSCIMNPQFLNRVLSSLEDIFKISRTSSFSFSFTSLCLFKHKHTHTQLWQNKCYFI